MESLLNQLCLDSRAALAAFQAKDREAIGHMIDFLQYTIDAVNLKLDCLEGDDD